MTSGLPFDDVRGEFGGVAAADILRRVDRSGWDEQGLTGLERHRRLAFELVFQQALDDVGDLFAGMAVRGKRHPGGEVDTHLDDFASRDA